MQQRYSISVIIPAYNREKYVTEALDSVARQERLPDEAIVVDDGSTDRTVDVVESWIRKHDLNIRLIRQTNQGASAARNTAIKNAQGDLIAPLDSDDVFLPHHLKLLESAFIRHPDLALCFGDAGRISVPVHKRQSDFENSCIDMLEYDEESDGLRLIRNSVFLSIIGGTYISMCSTMFAKSIAERIGGFDESLRNAEDREFWLRMSKAGRFAYYDEQVSLVRRHDSNLTHRRTMTVNRRNHVAALEKIIRQAEMLGLTPDELHATETALQDTWRHLPQSASQVGLTAYLGSCVYLVRRGRIASLLALKPLLRACLRPFGTTSQVATKQSNETVTQSQ